MTTLYGVLRGRPPKFFDGNAQTFTGLRFHLENEVFEFYQGLKMHGDLLWIDLTQLMLQGNDGLGAFVAQLSADPLLAPKVGEYAGRLSRILGIADIELHIDEVTGSDKTIDVVVDIFNRVNSGGTKLSKGDLALAKICAEWPDARDSMKNSLQTWNGRGYQFNLDWLLRSVNTVLTGEAKFSFLHDKEAADIQGGLKRATKTIETCLNMIEGRLGLDHDRVLFGRFAIPVMVRYLDQKGAALSAVERDKLLFWFVQAGMWGRYSGSTETYIDQDLAALEGDGDPLERLLEQVRLWHGGGLRTEAGHFTGWSMGARFYPVLYLLTRMGEAADWGTGLPLKSSLLGKMSSLEVHHIFPKARLYKLKYPKSEVNALANFCFLTKDTNLKISDRLPEEYFPEVERDQPGALASQWIPNDTRLWKAENYQEFLTARRELLADEANKRMEDLLHGDGRWLEGPAKIAVVDAAPVLGGVTSAEEEEALGALNQWIVAQGLPAGELSFEHSDPTTGEQLAIFDLAWPNGLQAELSEPVAVLLNEEAATLASASAAGFRCFTDLEEFRQYVHRDIIALAGVA